MACKAKISKLKKYLIYGKKSLYNYKFIIDRFRQSIAMLSSRGPQGLDMLKKDQNKIHF